MHDVLYIQLRHVSRVSPPTSRAVKPSGSGPRPPMRTYSSSAIALRRPNTRRPKVSRSCVSGEGETLVCKTACCWCKAATHLCHHRPHRRVELWHLCLC